MCDIVGILRDDILIILRDEFEEILTDEIIITDNQRNHIIDRHGQKDYNYFDEYREIILNEPDIVLKDIKHEGTIFVIKKIESLNVNINVLIRLVLETDNPDYKNSVITTYRLRDKNLQKLIDKNILIYSRENIGYNIDEKKENILK